MIHDVAPQHAAPDEPTPKPSRRHRPPKPVIALVVLSLLGVGGWWIWRETRPAVSTALVASGGLETTTYRVAATLAGRVVGVDAVEGQSVTAGQPLVRLDPTALELQVKQAQQGVLAAQAAVESAKTADEPSASDIAAAEARVKQAEAAVQIAQVQLGYATVAAPHAGVVVSVTVNAGENAAPGRTLVTLADPAELYARIYVPQPRLAEATIGRRVDVSADGAVTRPGTITWVATTAEFTPNQVETTDQRATLVYQVKVKVTDPTGLRPGQPVRVTFP